MKGFRGVMEREQNDYEELIKDYRGRKKKLKEEKNMARKDLKRLASAKKMVMRELQKVMGMNKQVVEANKKMQEVTVQEQESLMEMNSPLG